MITPEQETEIAGLDRHIKTLSKERERLREKMEALEGDAKERVRLQLIPVQETIMDLHLRIIRIRTGGNF